MQLTEERLGNACVLKLSARIDYASAGPLKAALQPYLDQCEEGGDVLVLDFSAVEYISSAGFRVLLFADRQVRARRGAIAVASLQPEVKEIFEISKFIKVIPCFEDVPGALAMLSPQAGASTAAD